MATLLRALFAQCAGPPLPQGRSRLPAGAAPALDRRSLEEARKDLADWLDKWGARYPRLCEWVEADIEETLTFYLRPVAHHKHLKSTNMLERVNEELRRRTHVIRILTNAESCLRLELALAVEIHEGWIEQHRYLNMEMLREHRRVKLELSVA